MRVSIPNPIPEQPSEVDIVRSEFALERLEELAEKLEENFKVHEHKARRMIEAYTKVKGEN